MQLIKWNNRVRNMEYFAPSKPARSDYSYNIDVGQRRSSSAQLYNRYWEALKMRCMLISNVMTNDAKISLRITLR